MRSSNRTFVPEIDELRAGAALLIIFYHGLSLVGAARAGQPGFDYARDWIFSLNPLVTLVVEGHSAVSMFIVLSGYILSLGAIGARIDYPRFLLARILRIYPVYLLLLFAACLSAPATLPQMLAALLPLPLPTSAMVASPLSSMFWAVLVELQCYLVFPFLILFSNRLGSRYLLGLITTLLAIRLATVYGAGASARDLSYWTVLGRLDQFVAGMLLARATLAAGAATETLRRRLFPLAALLVVAMLWLFNRAGGWPSNAGWKVIWPDLEALVWALFIACYIPFSSALTTRAPLQQAKILLQRLGLISYPVYLIHVAMIALAIRNGLMLAPTGNPHFDALLTTAFVVLPLSVAAGVLLHVHVEQPFLTLRTRYVIREETAPDNSQPAPNAG